jgi:hypothetical protein
MSFNELESAASSRTRKSIRLRYRDSNPLPQPGTWLRSCRCLVKYERMPRTAAFVTFEKSPPPSVFGYRSPETRKSLATTAKFPFCGDGGRRAVGNAVVGHLPQQENLDGASGPHEGGPGAWGAVVAAPPRGTSFRLEAVHAPKLTTHPFFMDA